MSLLTYKFGDDTDLFAAFTGLIVSKKNLLLLNLLSAENWAF